MPFAQPMLVIGEAPSPENSGEIQVLHALVEQLEKTFVAAAGNHAGQNRNERSAYNPRHQGDRASPVALDGTEMSAEARQELRCIGCRAWFETRPSFAGTLLTMT